MKPQLTGRNVLIKVLQIVHTTINYSRIKKINTYVISKNHQLKAF